MKKRGIKITNGVELVELRPGIKFEIEPERICKKTVMASGRTVMDIIGYKNMLKIPTGWLSKQQLYVLRSMILKDPILTVEYPEGAEWKSDRFIFEMPKLVMFRYNEDGGEALGVELEAEQVVVSS